MKVIGFKDLKPLFGITFSRVHLWRLMKDGRFPKAVELGTHSRVWVYEEIESWLNAKIGDRNVHN